MSLPLPQFDGTEMPYLSEWEEATEAIENVHVTEAGTDQVELVRAEKVTFSCGGNVLASDMIKFEAFKTRQYFTLRTYDPLTHGYISRKVRMRGFTKSLMARSEKLDATDGIWTISFNLIEF